ncbi:hypothetical protein TOPH_05904 [Tolypocladium ophioglossoides CBS 100239]|uniref:Transmembrane protein n=1 Tax=Tolypocladium ophioglossoides (strain CBS 100239) TaxID=1163406 RepID=A0A0L0N654_TOLOC|nr:hypothetical protein TOPH_05904 [Tolypocladium ophioglossoides CBS 100239]
MRRANPRQVGFICDSCALVRVHAQASKQPFTNRLLSTQTRGPSKPLVWRTSAARWTSTAAASVPAEPEATTKRVAVPSISQQISDPQELANVAEDSRKKFLSVDGIPAQQLTTAALQSCLRAATALHPQLKRAEAQSKASASRLVTLGAERTGARLPIDAKLQDAINRISLSAYTIITHPNVEMAPEFLELYVQTQAQLGRPESLPSVLELYATKPKPVVKDGEIQYVPKNPNAASRAIEVGVAALALQTAIESKTLDSALGIIEASYCVPAFRRQKLLKHATAPAIGLATLPFGIFGLSTAYAAYWQNTMDITTATGIGVAGISGYFFVVGSLGLIAKLSNKDQMKRATWAPGTPLRYRWLREEERAALDRVACAWGFQEPWRHGEETGPEWEGLKEYMGYRQMLLDRVEFMDGMS